MKRREFTLAMASSTAALSTGVARAQGKKPEDGSEYISLDRRVPVEAPAGKIEVIEFFWYDCPHCNAFEPKLEAWIKKNPADVHHGNVMHDKDLILAARAAFLARQWQSSEPVYKALASDFAGQIKTRVSDRFDRFAILRIWNHEEADKCEFSVEPHGTKGAGIPVAVQEKIRQNLFVDEDFDEMVVSFAEKNLSMSKLLAELREHPELAGMRVLQRGNRLSITPVEPTHWRIVLRRLDQPRPVVLRDHASAVRIVGDEHVGAPGLDFFLACERSVDDQQLRFLQHRFHERLHVGAGLHGDHVAQGALRLEALRPLVVHRFTVPDEGRV